MPEVAALGILDQLERALGFEVGEALGNLLHLLGLMGVVAGTWPISVQRPTFGL